MSDVSLVQVIDFSPYMEEFKRSPVHTESDLTDLLSNFRTKSAQWRSMFVYGLWYGFRNGIISNYQSVRDYVVANMGQILGKVSDNQAYVIGMALVVDKVFSDVWDKFHYLEVPYVDNNGNPISPEMLIFNPVALTNCYSFKGFYEKVGKALEARVIDSDTAFQIRQEVLRLFLDGTRQEIVDYRDKVYAILDGNVPERQPYISLEHIEIGGDFTTLTIKISSEFIDALNKAIKKSFGVDII